MCDVMLGDRDVNLESLRALYAKNRVKAVDGWTCRVLGEIILNLGGSHVVEAEHWIQKAIEADERNGMRFHLGRDYALYGEFSIFQKDRAKTQLNLGKAIEILKECGADGFVRKYEEEMAKLA
jgi:hypothetical protein